ncbi:MAG TPA: TonB-dependent receptor [Vicinamibacterales bacterium]|nr:TonB-dependent receptor [Vicinamibacterales bacterium]
MNRRLFRLGLSAVLALVLCAANSLAYAQGSTTSTITGRVVDASGGVLPGATIVAKHTGTNVETTTVTNSEGNFTLPSLPAGTYEVTVSLEGFKTTVVRDVVITAVQGAQVNAKLEVGGITEQVTVASSSEIIQTQSSTIASTITTNQITKLPLTSRSAMDFVNFLPGVSTPGGNRAATINGLPQGLINITIDGVNVQDNTNRSTDGFFSIVSPRLDAIEEVSVTTAGQGGDAGQGAVQIKMVTRSGGNSYTGSAYHYYRNDALNANTWFNNRAQISKPVLEQHQTGARFGGPLVIPGLVGRGKAFFFGNYEEFRQPSETSRNRNLLTPAAAQGTYTFPGGQSVNVLSFASARGLASSSTIDPTIAALLNDIRAAAGTTGTIASLDPNVDQLRYNLLTTSLRRFPTGRIDYNVTDSHRFTSALNYNYYTDTPDTLNSYDPTFPGFPVQGGQTSIRLVLSNSLRSTLGRNLVNEFRVGYSGAPVKFFSEMNVGMYTGSVANQNGRSLIFPSVGSALTSAGVTAPVPQSRNATDLAIDNNLTWLKGNHNVSAGVSFSHFNVWLKNTSLVPRVSFGILNTDPANTVFSSANIAAAAGVTPSAAQLTAIRNLYSLLTGRVTQISADARVNEKTGLYEYVGEGIQRSNMQEAALFVQDSWRWRPNFTVNAGVRYTMQFPFKAGNNSYSTTTMEDVCGISGVNQATGFCNLFQPGNMPGKAISEFYNLEKGKNAYNTDWDNIAPNVGFAWTPARRGGFLGTLMSDELVIRGGWARAYSREGMGVFTGQYNANPGVAIAVLRNEGNGNILPAGSPGFLLHRNEAQMGPPAFPERQVYPMTDLITEDIRLFDPNIQIPYGDTWSFGVQRRLTTNTALEVRYVGTLSRDRWLARNYNEINIWENGFIDEFRRAQSNLMANLAAGRGATFAFTGAPGTQPLPIMIQWLSGRPASAAGATANYTGTFWTNTTLLNNLAIHNPAPNTFANNIMNTAALRTNGATAGAPANFFLTNPNKLGGAFVTKNDQKSEYHSLQVELRRRLANGLQFQSSYVYGQAMESVFLTHRRPLVMMRDIGSPGDLTHQFKSNIVYDLPFGQGRRFLSGAGPVMERIVGGWQIGLNTRIQSGMLTEVGGVRLVGWTADEVKKAYGLRFDHANKQVYMWPQDVIDNTILAFSTAPTLSGYSGAAPTGRYFAPANSADCIEIASQLAECPGVVQSLVLTGPTFNQHDLRIAKRTQIVGRVNFEIAGEALNVFNHVNFVPNAIPGTPTTQANWLVTGLTGTNTSRTIQIVSRLNW